MSRDKDNLKNKSAGLNAVKQNKSKGGVLKCFAPLAGKAPKVLILGTMPGGTALKKRQYYGYEHNAFWKIMFEIFETPFSADYKVRANFLKSNSVALWDTVASCERKGSGDAAVKNAAYNNIEGFLQKHKSVKAVFLNGRSAYKFFLKAVKNEITACVFTLPSTSPAHAVPYAKKLAEWLKIKDFTSQK
jgi:hypoxanthine-DNA glycosylase